MRMAPIGPDLARKLVGIAARLASNHDGEALIAARMLVAKLSENGQRIEDVIERGLAPPCQSTAPEPVSPGFSHQRDATEAAAAPWDDFYSAKETDFLRSMQVRPSCSPAQREWLDRLVAKARAAREAA